MTNEEIFDRAMSRYGIGRRLAREKLAGTPAGEGYAQVAEQAETLIASAKQFLPRLPDIHFDFGWNGSVNAFAFKESGKYFIGITTGAIVLLQLVLNRILADSRLLMHAGDPGCEDSALPPLVGLIPEAQRMYETGTLNPIRPKTDARRSYAMHLFFQGTLFLIGHEIAHIAFGHVDYLDSKTASPFLPEIGWNLASPAGRIERQILEVNADMRSLASRLESLRLTVTNPSQTVPSWLSNPLGFKDLLFDCAFPIHALFRIFGDVRLAGTDLSSASYPPLPFRRAMLTAFALSWAVSHLGIEYKDAVATILRQTAMMSESAFATITGESLSPGGLQDAFGREGLGHMKLLQDCWLGGLRDRLAPFAYDPEPVPPRLFADESEAANA